MQLEEQILKSGIKKNHIAQLLNVNPNTLSNWISGRSFPRLDQAVQLAVLLNVRITDLYQMDEEE